jgi:hypothetical protein
LAGSAVIREPQEAPAAVRRSARSAALDVVDLDAVVESRSVMVRRYGQHSGIR